MDTVEYLSSKKLFKTFNNKIIENHLHIYDNFIDYT